MYNSDMLVQAAKLCATRLVRREVCGKIFRWNSTKISNKIMPTADFKMTSVSKEEKQSFNSYYPGLVKDLMDSMKGKNLPEMMKWYPCMLDYNLLGGKQRRGLTLVMSYKLLEDPKKLSEENLRLANILGWTTEMLTSFDLIIDDIVDQSEMRRGLPCWYHVENVGHKAITDAVVLENEAYMILRKYFRNHPCYSSFYELFHETISSTFQGQVMDHLSGKQTHQNLQHFTMDRYKTIASTKFGIIAFGFPVQAAMYLAGIQDAELHRKTAALLQKMGMFLQIKNDYLDCFGTLDTNGATLYGDIREGTCAWPAVVTMEKSTPEQRAIMEQCYGNPEEQSVQAVMEVYRALDIPAMYASFQEEYFTELRNQIEQLDVRLPKKVFYNTLYML